MTGGLNPSPERFGGQAGNILELIIESLDTGRGTAYDPQDTSVIHAENISYARALYDLWQANERLANQFDPFRMTDFLSRWENILNIKPLPTDNNVQRRAAIGAHMAMIGQAADLQGLRDLMSRIIPDIYVTILNITAQDTDYLGYSIGSCPGAPNLTSKGGAKWRNGYWTSGINRIMIQTAAPAWMDDNTFYLQASKVITYLMDWMPAWTVFDWFRHTPDGYGGDAKGFYLDHINLDNVVFDI